MLSGEICLPLAGRSAWKWMLLCTTQAVGDAAKRGRRAVARRRLGLEARSLAS